MPSMTTIGSLLLMTQIGTAATLVPLPYDMDKGAVPMQHAKFSNLSAAEYTPLDSASATNDDIKLSIIVGVAKELATGSREIDPEFVDIVNERFWEMI